MIIDNIKNAGLYSNICPLFSKAIDAIKKYSDKETGRYEIDGDKLYLMVQEYQPKNRSEAKFEGHRKYMDIQFIQHGREEMHLVNISGLKTEIPYNPEKDVEFFQKPDTLHTAVLSDGDFAVFFPDDVHAPGLAPEDIAGDVRKILVKILL